MTTRIEHQHGTDINIVRACNVNTNAPDLVAIGGEHSVDVLQLVGVLFMRHVMVWERRVSLGRATTRVQCLRPFTLVSG